MCGMCLTEQSSLAPLPCWMVAWPLFVVTTAEVMVLNSQGINYTYLFSSKCYLYPSMLLTLECDDIEISRLI